MIVSTSHAAARMSRASPIIEGPKKFFEKRLTERGNALRCTARDGRQQTVGNDGVKKIERFD